MKKLLFILLLSSCTPVFDSVEPTIEQPQLKISIAQAKQKFIDTMTFYGEWAKYDMFQVRVDTSLANAVYYSDWKDTSRHPVSYGTIGAFYVNGGIKGSVTYRINTMYNPYTDGVNFTQDDNCFGVYVGSRIVENKADISALQTGTLGCEIQANSTSSTTYGYDNTAINRNQGNDIGRGLHAVKRTASNFWTTTIGGYKGALNFTDASSPIVDQPMWEYCRSVNTTYSKNTTRTHYLVFAGSGDADLFLMNKIFEKEYLLPLGLCPTKRITFLGNSYISARLIPQYTMAGINDYNNLDLNVAGVSGYTTPQVLGLAQTNVFPFQKDYLTNDVVFICEGTNDYTYRSGNASLMYDDMVALCDSVKYHNPSAYIVVMTMPPKTGSVNRQNDSNLNDTAYYNGMLRVKLVRDGHATSICDIASDTLIGLNGQNTNITYYKTDALHWNATGTQYAVDNYIKASILNGL